MLTEQPAFRAIYFPTSLALILLSALAANSQVLVEDDFDGAADDPPDSTRFTWGGEVSQDGNSLLNFSTWTANTSWLQSITNATPGAGETLVLRMRLSAYAEPAVYGDLQPRGLRVGNDANNVVEFYSIYGTTLGLRTRKDGVESMISYPFPQNVYAMHDYEIDVSTTSAVFKVDGVVAGTITNNLPTGALNIYMDTYDGGAGNVPISLDSVSLTLTNNQAQGPPEIYNFSPMNGPVGTSVAISGTNFTGVSTVQFNGVDAQFTNNSDSLITAVVPDTAGTGLITVVSTNGTASSTDNFVVTPLDYTWTTNDGTVTISGYTGAGGDVTIPTMITGLPVTAIGMNAFYSCASLTNVTIPDSVTSIGDTAFVNCTSLTNVTIGAGVTNIGYHTFYNCRGLMTFSVDAGNSAFSSADGVLFDKEQTSLLLCPMQRIGAYTVPGGVLNIEDGAFDHCANLDDVVVGDTVTNIGSGAFYACTDLTNVLIGSSVTNIGNAAFYNCTSLTNIIIPDSVVSISGAFSDCYGLASVTLGTNVADISGAFVRCYSLTNINLPDSLTAIGDEAFSGCSHLPGITIPGTVTSIGRAAFDSCATLTNLAIPFGVSNIAPYAFEYCTGLTNISIPDSVLSIEYDAFKHCDSLADFTIPDSVTNLGSEAFYFCGRLASAIIGDGLVNIPSEAFYGCDSLTSVVIGSNVNTIGNYAFDGCGSLASVTIPNSVANIGDDAFADCSSLTNISLGNNVATIGSSAFAWCGSLISAALPASVTSIGSLAFEQCSNLTAITVDAANSAYSSVDGVLFDRSSTTLLVYPPGKGDSYSVPDGVTSIGNYAFDYCFSLTNVMVPNSVTNIGDDAFDNCSSLIKIVVPDSVTSIGYNAFSYSGLTSIVVGAGVTNIGSYAFDSCSGLASVYFRGNAPTLGSGVFDNNSHATVYYLPDTSGWGDTFGGRPTAVWPLPIITSFSPTSGPVGTEISINGTNFTGTSSVQLNGADLPFSVLSETQITATVAAEPTSGLISVTTANGTGTSQTSFYVSSPATDFTYTTNNGAITITGYLGSSGDVIVPSIINGLPVTLIGYYAFEYCSSLTNVMIPDGITSIESGAFYECTGLMSVTIPDSVTSIGGYAFYLCGSLTNVTIGNGVASIGDFAFYSCTDLSGITIGNGVTAIGSYAFESCSSLTNVVIPDSVTVIGSYAFYDCTNLVGIYFKGNAPGLGYDAVFGNDDSATVYRLATAGGWPPVPDLWGGLPTALWSLTPEVLPGSCGVVSNQFSFSINWPGGQSTVVVEACTNLASPVWQPISTNTLNNGLAKFGDPQWANFPRRFYRIRTP